MKLQKLIKVFLFGVCSVVMGQISIAGDGDSEEIGCSAKYHTYYSGYLVDANGITNASASVKLSQRAKNGVASATMTLNFLDTRAKRTFICSPIHMPESVVFESAATGDKIRATVTTYMILGNYNGSVLKLYSNKNNGSVELNPMDALAGYWSFVVKITGGEISNDEVDRTNFEFASFSIQIKKKGRIKIVGYLPDGWKASKTYTLTDESEYLVLPVNIKKSFRKGHKQIRFDLRFKKDNLLQPEITNGEWICTVEGEEFYKGVELLTFGLPNVDKKEVRKRVFEVTEDGSTQNAKISSINEKSGVLTGKFVYWYEDARQRLRKKNGTITGVAVDGVCYGVGLVKNVMTIPVIVQK